MSKIWEFFDTMEEIWYYNPFLEWQVMLKDTLVEADGKEYRMELAIDSDRQELLDKLKEMSYCDQLTQIGNRHAMNEYIDNLQKEQSLGIVYCDVTGLKQVNDQKGHASGDKLIAEAEKKMYQDKAAYYKKYGFDRRHSWETVANWM